MSKDKNPDPKTTTLYVVLYCGSEQVDTGVVELESPDEIKVAADAFSDVRATRAIIADERNPNCNVYGCVFGLDGETPVGLFHSGTIPRAALEQEGILDP